jgi:uncharacterized SAM-binding protein YcdF (DUF218 family)
MEPTGRRRWRRRALVTLAALGVASATTALAVRQVGYWLIVGDPLSRATAVVVLAGDFPFRAVEGASLYRQGWAPEVWLLRTAAPAREAALARLGFAASGEEASNRLVLERLAVPGRAIRVLDGRAANTAEEVRLVARELGRVRGGGVIIVTSKAHSRRVGATWSALVGASPRAIVRYARQDPFEPGRWWRTTRDALAVSREVFGLLNVWAGFPVQPEAGTLPLPR